MSLIFVFFLCSLGTTYLQFDQSFTEMIMNCPVNLGYYGNYEYWTEDYFVELEQRSTDFNCVALIQNTHNIYQRLIHNSILHRLLEFLRSSGNFYEEDPIVNVTTPEQWISYLALIKINQVYSNFVNEVCSILAFSLPSDINIFNDFVDVFTAIRCSISVLDAMKFDITENFEEFCLEFQKLSMKLSLSYKSFKISYENYNNAMRFIPPFEVCLS